MTIDKASKDVIKNRLQDIENTEGVRILYAAESGSRAWGFPSPDSDFDVRFIYLHEKNWYLSLEPGQDVIERPLDNNLIDLSGWDLKKSLRLLLRWNPSLSEWVRSPIVYRDDGILAAQIRKIFDQSADLRTLGAAYASQCRTNWQKHIAARNLVRRKKYFYVIRPALCLLWIKKKQEPPPIRVPTLLGALNVSEAVLASINRLTQEKASSSELTEGPRDSVLDAWLSEVQETTKPESFPSPSARTKDIARQETEALFISTVEANSHSSSESRNTP